MISDIQIIKVTDKNVEQYLLQNKYIKNTFRKMIIDFVINQNKYLDEPQTVGTKTEEVNYFIKHLRKKTGILYLGFDKDSVLIGYIFSSRTIYTQVIHITEFFINEKYRGHGYGKRFLYKTMYDLIIQYPKQQYIRLSVLRNNLTAQKLYEQFQLRIQSYNYEITSKSVLSKPHEPTIRLTCDYEIIAPDKLAAYTKKKEISKLLIQHVQRIKKTDPYMKLLSYKKFIQNLLNNDNRCIVFSKKGIPTQLICVSKSLILTDYYDYTLEILTEQDIIHNYNTVLKIICSKKLEKENPSIQIFVSYSDYIKTQKPIILKKLGFQITLHKLCVETSIIKNM